MPGDRKPSKGVASALSTRPSPYNASVTLISEAPLGLSSARRSGRLESNTLGAHEKEATEEMGYSKVEPDIEDIPGPSERKAKVSTSTRKRKESAAYSGSPRKAKSIRLALDVPHPAPGNWQETYATIKEMRKGGGAPVDEMGCHMAGGPVNDPKTKRFVTLISLMLSSQTKDEVTHAAVSNLRAALGELTVENVLAADEFVISDAIGKVGFWRRKTQYIVKASQKLKDDFEGEVPKTVDDLCSLPGVGPKMAFLALQVAWNINVGIGVDVHVHRITNRLGWHRPPTKEPEQTRLNLQSWLPTDLHGEINPLLVGFGQTICLPTAPRCDSCALSTKGLCPSARVGVKGKARRTVAKRASIGPKVVGGSEESLIVSKAKSEPEDEVKDLDKGITGVQVEVAKQEDLS